MTHTFTPIPNTSKALYSFLTLREFYLNETDTLPIGGRCFNGDYINANDKQTFQSLEEAREFYKAFNQEYEKARQAGEEDQFDLAFFDFLFLYKQDEKDSLLRLLPDKFFNDLGDLDTQNDIFYQWGYFLEQKVVAFDFGAAVKKYKHSDPNIDLNKFPEDFLAYYFEQ